LNINRLPTAIFEALAAGAALIVPNAQRQALVRASWAESQRASARRVWSTPNVTTLAQLTEERLRIQSAEDDVPDPLLPAAAEWAAIRELRRNDGGIAEARALLASVRTLADWQLPRDAGALGASPEAVVLADTLRELASLAGREQRSPVRDLVGTLRPARARLLAAGFASPPPLTALTLTRHGARLLDSDSSAATPVAIATAETDDHEIELIAAWCRAHLERDPARRLLIVDSRLRSRRRAYERVLSQTLTPSEWLSRDARRFSTVFAIEGGQPLVDFPLIAHALLTLRLLTGRLPFHDVVRWLRMPFLDRADVFAGAATEAHLRTSRQLDYGAIDLAAFLERDGRGEGARQLAAQLRTALGALAGERRTPAEWAPRLLAGLRAAGWHGSRALRSDEQQTVARWHMLLDEYSALGAWVPRAPAAAAVDTLADLAAERFFDPASVAAPVTLTDSHDDPVVRFDGIWVAGLDDAQWPAAPRPDVFIPLRLQNAAGIPAASAAGQTRIARHSLAAWRAATDQVVCSWARLDGDAHRTISPLLGRLEGASNYQSGVAPALAVALRDAPLEIIDDEVGVAVDRARPVAGGVRPLELQAECGFHAYAEVRLRARELESPQPGLDRRDRGRMLHKALELVWLRLDRHFHLKASEPRERAPMIAAAVEAAIAHVFRGLVPAELMHAVDRERLRLERLIETLLQAESDRAPFRIDALESSRAVSIAGGHFEVRIDRIDAIEGGGFAILDYKSGEPRPLGWSADDLRNPQLIAYLLAERGRDVQALANVSLASERVTFTGRASRQGLLPGVRGYAANKVPAHEIDAAWTLETTAWIDALQRIAADYLAGRAPVEPGADVCRHCALTTLCRRLELSEESIEPEDGDD
jgi:ATP-dependent helicase/nuclease subunit B